MAVDGNTKVESGEESRTMCHTHLASKSYRSLIKSLLLRISDIRRNNTVKWKSMIGLFELVAVGLCLDGQLATHGVLNIANRGVQTVGSKRAHVLHGRRESPR